MALIDPDKAMKLIQLTALPEEILGLQTEALLLVADSNPETFHRMIADFGYDNLVPRSIDVVRGWLWCPQRGHDRCDRPAAPRFHGQGGDPGQAGRRAQEREDDAARELCDEALQTVYRLEQARRRRDCEF